jgi:uncharacterized membrane protein YhaH (DUF805 family)
MDPDQQHAANMMAGMGAGILLFIAIIFLAFLAFFIFLYWRIFTKAGLSGPLSLLILIPGIGPLIPLCILAFSEWKVVPAPQLYPGLQPYPPPPPPSYPPAPPTL